MVLSFRFAVKLYFVFVCLTPFQPPSLCEINCKCINKSRDYTNGIRKFWLPDYKFLHSCLYMNLQDFFLLLIS